MRRDLPTGTVTFLFTDVEGSTRLLHELGAERYAAALAEHRRVVREACTERDGAEVDTQGDAFFVAFPTVPGAVEAAQAIVDGLKSGPIRVRIGMHTGTPHVSDEGYVGKDVHLAARVAASGHGGQILASASTVALIEASGSEPQALSLRELGEHRLKDIAEPVPIYQLGEDSFPPLKTISNTNLPRPASSFVGRQRELEEVLDRIQAGARLLTLTGPGGSGKTRLALEAAASLVPEYKAGVFWVGLAALRDHALVTETIAQTLGAKDGLAENIAERELLLLLDNLEQVIEAAPELAALLEACPNLGLLVTSRELLRVRGEVEYSVPPLAAAEAIDLFCTRAQLEPSPEIAELCARLDSLPLGVELAAARTKALSPGQILERLSQRLDLLRGGRDAEARQQTLRATIEWSYDLLTPEEQQLFARLSVFAGGCTLETAEEVADGDLDTLQSLVEKSLLRYSNERYRMLETIREYAGERLEEAGETEGRRTLHAAYYSALAEEAQPHLWRGSPGGWLDRLEAEHDNLRAALDRLEVSGETQRALRLTGAMWSFWNARGHLSEGRRRLEAVLAADEGPTAARARALTGAAAMAALSGDAATARIRAEEALALHRALGDARGTALSQSYIATAAAVERDWTRAREIAEENIRAYRALGDEDTAMLATWLLAWMSRELGDRERSKALTEENLRRARALGNERVEAMSLGALAMLAVELSNSQDALAMLTEALRIDRDLGERLEVALDLCRFAHVLAAAGRCGTATRLLAKGEALREEIGATLESYAWMETRLRETHAAIRGQLDEAAFAEAWEQGRALTVDEAVALALGSLD